MSYSKSIAIALTAFACAATLAVDASAQRRGGSGGHGGSAGRASSGARSAPRGGSPSQAVPRQGGRAPLPSSRYPYYSYGHRPGYGGYGYRYGYPGFSLGLGLGYPYGYGYYGYGYPYYGYPYYGYGYGGYYAPGGAYPYGSGYVEPGGAAYGGVRIQGAPANAEVYVDGNYAGIVDDFNGTFQRLDLEPGSHAIEIRTPGRPLMYDINVTPGQTLTIHANVR